MTYSKFKPLDKIYNSRRGKYQLTQFTELLQENSALVWKPEPLPTSVRATLVRDEISAAFLDYLDVHPFWKDEPKEFVDEYTKFYKELFGLDWLHNPEDRHNIVANKTCCLTVVQYHDGVLHAYSRSTDMRNGYYADKLILDYLAECIGSSRPDCKVEKICWYLAVPHVYVQKGIARLGDT